MYTPAGSVTEPIRSGPSPGNRPVVMFVLGHVCLHAVMATMMPLRPDIRLTRQGCASPR
jgi:hypothetical protein